MERRNAWKTYTQEQLKELDQINDRYKVCLDEGKTERECIRLTVKEIEKQGYRNLNDIKGSLKTGDKVYAVCMGKSIAMFRVRLIFVRLFIRSVTGVRRILPLSPCNSSSRLNLKYSAVL